MSSLRYKILLSYLPGMASVVNAFQSPQVQNTVYETLMEALEAKLKAEGIGLTKSVAPSRDPQRFAVSTPGLVPSPAVGGEFAHDLVEGDSIHGDTGRSSITSTVF